MFMVLVCFLVEGYFDSFALAMIFASLSFSRFHAAARALWRAVSAAEEMEALTYRVLMWELYIKN
jgi:hypothetical protein|tara:strand:- start:163 stop:357 length:195 start_codon:yes stop_codon:yes gene_type:complete